MRITTSKLTSVAVAAGLAVGVLGTAGPASAVPVGGDTITTFTIEGGTLEISAPSSADLGTAPAGNPFVHGWLGPVTVLDNRAAADASWTASASSSGFSTGAGGIGEYIAPHQISYDSGFAMDTSGTGTFSPGWLVPLDGMFPVFTHTGGTGRNSATWNPTISTFLNYDQVAGVYTGVITHSVA